MNKSKIISLSPDELLERYDELNGEIFCNGMLQADELNEEFDSIMKQMLDSLKLKKLVEEENIPRIIKELEESIKSQTQQTYYRGCLDVWKIIQSLLDRSKA